MFNSILLLAIIQGVPASHSKPYAEILRKHVKNGRVDYKAINAKDLGKLDAYIRAVGEAKPSEKQNDRLAFYVDAYNAIVIKAVIGNKRPRSVLDVKGFFNKKTWTVAGRSVTLDELEKKIINPLARDPRTHFVLVCGAVGCPVLESRPYLGSIMSQRMDKSTRRYLATPYGAIVGKGTLKLSKIFDWYKKDFGGAPGVVSFVKRHLPDPLQKKLGDQPSVTFLEYNWTLNQQ